MATGGDGPAGARILGGKSAVRLPCDAPPPPAGSVECLLISPLLALMRNQIEAARRSACAPHDQQRQPTRRWARSRLWAATRSTLLVSPERFANPAFRDKVLPRSAQAGLLVIDERTASATGATTSAPTTAASAACSICCPAGVPVLCTHRDRQRPRRRRHRRSARRRSASLRGPLDRESLALARRRPADRRPSAWPGSPRRSRRCRAPASSTASPSRDARPGRRAGSRARHRRCARTPATPTPRPRSSSSASC